MSVVVVLLLYYTLTVVNSVPVSVSNITITTTCDVNIIKDNITGHAGLDFSCDITEENRATVLQDIRGDGIKSLFIIIIGNQDFVFGDRSFSKDLESLTIKAAYPLFISSGTFKGSGKIKQLDISLKFDSLRSEIYFSEI